MIVFIRFDELVVGAPFYYNQHSSGAVYIYVNSKSGISKDAEYTRIEGEIIDILLLLNVIFIVLEIMLQIIFVSIDTFFHNYSYLNDTSIYFKEQIAVFRF